MSEPSKVLKVSDPSQKWKIGLFVVFGAIALFLLASLPSNDRFCGAGDVDLESSVAATGTVVLVSPTLTTVLPAQSGRVWFRLTGIGTSSVSCALTDSTAGMVLNTSIFLGTATSGIPRYFDSGESHLNYQGAVTCLSGNTTSGVATYSRTR